MATAYIDAQAVAQSLTEAFNDHNLEAMRAFYSPDAELVWPGGLTYTGSDSIISHWSRVFDTMPGIHQRVERRIVEGSHVATEWTVGVHRPHENPRAGEPGAVQGVDIITVEDGRVVRQQFYFDPADLPTLASASERQERAAFGVEPW